MSIFGKQLQDRIEKDEELQDKNLRMLSVATKGRKKIQPGAKESPEHNIMQLEMIFQYLSIPFPENVPVGKDIDEQIDLVLQPSGVMCREIELNDIWWKNGDGPILAVMAGSKETKALIPGLLSGYRYTDSDSGKKIRVTKKNKDLFEKDGWCFYKPLPPESMGPNDFILFLLRQLRASDVALFILSFIFITLFGAITPAVTAFAFADLVPSGQKVLLIPMAVLLFTVAFGSWLMNIAKTSVNNRIGTRLDVIEQNAVFGRVMNLPASFFGKETAGGIAQKVSALGQIPMLLSNILFGCVLTAAVSLIYVVELIFIAPSLALPALVTYVAELAIFTVTVAQEGRLIEASLTAGEVNGGVVYSFIQGIQKIKVSGSEKRAMSKWMESYSDKIRPSYVIRFPYSFRVPILGAITLLGTLWAYSVSYSKGLSVAEFAGFSSAFALAVSGITALGSAGSAVASIRPILRRGEPILRTKPEGRENKKSIRSLKGKIELNNVTFSYEEDSPEIIKNLSLKIEPGEYVAIVGPSGCGKSTLLRILLGFETPRQGTVYYDDQDIESVNIRSLRQHIGTVLQNGKLFTGDIFSNIIISVPWMDEAGAWEAAEKAGMADDIRHMPMGMHTFISEGGGGISGGQKQRLLIARAICGKPGILMFDEATSALDNITQKIVTDSLAEMHCTRIVIAHRLSTIRECDRILVLQNGSIQEEGTFDELMAKGGIFANLASRQLE